MKSKYYLISVSAIFLFVVSIIILLLDNKSSVDVNVTFKLDPILKDTTLLELRRPIRVILTDYHAKDTIDTLIFSRIDEELVYKLKPRTFYSYKGIEEENTNKNQNYSYGAHRGSFNASHNHIVKLDLYEIVNPDFDWPYKSQYLATLGLKFDNYELIDNNKDFSIDINKRNPKNGNFEFFKSYIQSDSILIIEVIRNRTYRLSFNKSISLFKSLTSPISKTLYIAGDTVLHIDIKTIKYE